MSSNPLQTGVAPAGDATGSIDASRGLTINIAASQQFPGGGPGSAQKKLMRRRSRKACVYCHSRKIRCDVGERGTPCSNCVDHGSGDSCTVRRRKNARAESPPPPKSGPRTNGTSNEPPSSASHDTFRRLSKHSATAMTTAMTTPPTITWPDSNNALQNHPPPHSQQPQSQQPQPAQQLDHRAHPSTQQDAFVSPPMDLHAAPDHSQPQPHPDERHHLQPQWNEQPPPQYMGHNAYPFFDPAHDHNSLALDPSAHFDFSNLVDIESLFTFNNNDSNWPQHDPPHPQVEFGFSTAHQPPPAHSQHLQHASPASVLTTASSEGVGRLIGTNPPLYAPAFLSTSDQNYLSGEGCFDLPPASTFRHMCTVYFNLIHPNLPIIDEAAFWSLWNGDNFHLSQFSFLVAQTMVFASASFVEADVLQSVGFSSQREARIAYYKRSKLLFDFAIERDPVANAQACLLLTFYAPNHNRARVNSHWVQQALRFARLAGADKFQYCEDPVTQNVMKRLWWCVLFRDRVISLCLRRPLQAELDPELHDERHILTVNDLQSEMGHSPVHDAATQRRIAEVIAATCRLAQCVTPACEIMFRHDRFEQRLQSAQRSLPIAIDNIRRALEGLRRWHDQTSQMFPYPISLDDAHETVCVFANMLFFYHDSAVFALHAFRILLDEASPSTRSRGRLDDAREAIAEAIDDTTKRTQELIQARLVSWLPISASALLSLPLVLQAINVTAARGSGMERVEMRKLEVFTKTLKNLQVKFDGADFFSDVLASIVAYAEDDSSIIASMTAGKQTGPPSGSNGHHHEPGGEGSGSPGRGADHHASSDSKGDAGASTSGSGLSTPRGTVKLGWVHLMQKRPRLFLRLLLHFDFALCTGASPKETDFPMLLRKSSHLTSTGRRH